MSAPAQCRLPLPGSMRETDILEFGSVAEELEARDRLLVRGDYDELRAATTAEIIAAARPAMSSPRAVREFLAVKLGTLEHEIFAVLLLDTRHRLIDYVELFRGTINGASVHPREVVKLALARNAAALVLAHPHPSGSPEPSQADELITHRLKEALALVDIAVLDHVIVAGGETVSFAERGML